MGDQFQGRVPVNKIIPFSAVDGPGNRTAVFVQGCNFNCRYCHNPETRSLCRSCGECVEKCPKQALYIENGKVLFHPELCCGCDTCIKTCRFDASPRIRYMNAQEVYQEICRQDTVHPRYHRFRRRVYALPGIFTGAVYPVQKGWSRNPRRQQRDAGLFQISKAARADGWCHARYQSME